MLQHTHPARVSNKQNAPTHITRRGALLSSLLALSPLAVDPNAASASASAPAAVAEVAAEPACASCVGYVDGTLGSCSAVQEPCSSSYDDRPQHFAAPWQYESSTQAARQRLTGQLQALGASIEQETDDYVYAVLDQGPSGVLDLEFVFAPNDTTVSQCGG